MQRIINRHSLAWVMYYSGFLFLVGLWGRIFNIGAPLFLVGHRVLPQNNNASATQDIDTMALLSGHAITDREFERRLKFLMRFRKPGDPLDLTGGLPGGRNFYLTFDDGYVDNARFAGPVLKRLGIKAVVFFIAEVMRKPSMLPWWDLWGSIKYSDGNHALALPEYRARCSKKVDETRGLLRDDSISYEWSDKQHTLYLSEGEANTLCTGETFYAANHSANHANFLCLSRDEFIRDIEDGMASISSAPGYLPLLAYPYGRYNKQVLDYVSSKDDITLAFATGWGTNDNHLTVKRIDLNASPFYLFVAESMGVFNLIDKLRNPLAKM